MDLSHVTIDALVQAEEWVNELTEVGETTDVDGLVLANTAISPEELYGFSQGVVAPKMLRIVTEHEGELPEDLAKIVAAATATTYQFALVSILRAVESG